MKTFLAPFFQSVRGIRSTCLGLLMLPALVIAQNEDDLPLPRWTEEELKSFQQQESAQQQDALYEAIGTGREQSDMTQELDHFPSGNCAASALTDRHGRFVLSRAPRVDGDHLLPPLMACPDACLTVRPERPARDGVSQALPRPSPNRHDP